MQVVFQAQGCATGDLTGQKRHFIEGDDTR